MPDPKAKQPIPSGADLKLITPSDLRREAEKLIAEGKMPQLDKLLGAVSEARLKYKPRIKALDEFSKKSVDKSPDKK